jgi:DNA-binding CsgD family transcriptional regulator
MRESLRSRIGLRSVHPEQLIVCEKQSGLPRFCVEINGDVGAAFERAATLLALTCSLRGDRPADYEIRVPARDSVKARVTKLAEELLRLGVSYSSSVNLSPRENEVLRELMRNRVNKEIAERLHISLRTVKFHVSALLAKFRVASRWDLILQAQRMFDSRHEAEDAPASQAADASNSRDAKKTSIPRKLLASGQGACRDQTRIIPFRQNLRPA